MDTNYSLSDIAAATGNGRNDGMWGGDGCWWIILFLLFGMFGWGGFGGGFGGYGGGGFNSPAGQGFATRTDIDAALATQGIENGIQNISTQLCNGFNTLGSQMANCCCDLKQGQGEINYNMAAQTNILQNTVNNNGNAIQQALNSGFRDVIDAQNAGTQRIVDLFTQDKIQSLQTELQSAQLQLSNVAQTNNIINALRPTPIPAYITCSPYQAATGYNCGCNVGCGC